ncbi:response regulator [Polyangium sp. y55x31]|uniref:response regulator n=1 Tax=Polyangium sp. y55x31 TaxID=3042688 RepID=UPI002482976D|nr:response regulator [Polyangium sp. y55x31]MDI1481764.1 response regulator [Polyangium sp. y55x31]
MGTTAGNGGSARRPRVLLVDDEPFIVTSIRRLLGTEHEVIAVSNGLEALAAVEAGARFDVVLCDVRMPGMNGFELYERLLVTAPEVAKQIVFFTGAAFTSEVRAFFARVENLLLEKPYDPSELRALVRKLASGGRDVPSKR